MSAEPAPINPAVVSRVRRWLKTHWTRNAGCPACGANSWSCGDRFELRHRDHGSIMPIVPLVCNDCGYTMLFNALRIGLASGSNLKAAPHDTSYSFPAAKTPKVGAG